MNIDLHQTDHIALGPVQELSNGKFCREMIITYRCGQTLTINVYSDSESALQVLI